MVTPAAFHISNSFDCSYRADTSADTRAHTAHALARGMDVPSYSQGRGWAFG